MLVPYKANEVDAQIERLRRWDMVEITSERLSLNPFGGNFLKTETYSKVAYFIESDDDKIKIGNNYDPCYLRLFGRKTIPINRISSIRPLDERVESK
ncbi:Uncharacterised protein [uncultured archaeon]|nr:Uncharacterised protein [uncultured archaeon]